MLCYIPFSCVKMLLTRELLKLMCFLFLSALIKQWVVDARIVTDRYLVTNNLLAPVFMLFRENRGRDNLINSAVIELVEVSLFGGLGKKTRDFLESIH